MRISNCLILLALVAGSGFAQSAPDTIKLDEVNFSGSLRSRMYDWDWFQPASGDSNYR